MISTYTLATESYDEALGSLPTGFVAPSDTPDAETYGGYQIAARRALRDLGYDVSTFPTAPVEIEDAQANDFRNLLNYYALLRSVAVATASANKIKAGPIEIQSKTYELLYSRLAWYRDLVADILGLPSPLQIGITELAYDFDDDIDAAYATFEAEYAR